MIFRYNFLLIVIFINATLFGEVISTNRPGNCNPTSVLKSGVINIENGNAFSDSKLSQIGSFFLTRIGTLGDKVEIDIRYDLSQESTTWGLVYALPSFKRYDLALDVDFDLEFNQSYFYLPFSTSFENFSFWGQTGLGFSEKFEVNDIDLTVAMGANITDNLSYYVETYSYNPDLNDFQLYFDAGFMYLILDNLQADVSYGVDLLGGFKFDFLEFGLSVKIGK